MWLSPDQQRLLGEANRLPFRAPVPTRMVSNGEFMPLGQTRAQRWVETLVRARAARLACRFGVDRDRFLRSRAGLLLTLSVMNQVFGRYFDARDRDVQDPDAAAASTRAWRDEFVFDVQTHHVRTTYRFDELLNLRRWAQGDNPQGTPWNPAVASLRPDLEQFKLEAYIKDMFLDSDTTVACLTGFTSETSYVQPLTTDEIVESRNLVNTLAGSRRLFAVGLFWPGYPGNLEAMHRAATELGVDGWKGYAVGDLLAESMYPWRMDDEKVTYPAFEKAAQHGIRNICVHKGLVPAVDYKAWATWPYAAVDDVARAARDWPQLNFIIFHAAFRPLLDSESAADEFRRSGTIPWVTDLAEIPGRHGVANVYAELGTTFAQTIVTFPELAAGILGQCIAGMGADHVLWGTDSVWWGSPQWQIEAFRRLEIPEAMRRAHGFAPLGPATGSVKRQILGLNAARLFDVDPGARPGTMSPNFPDRLAVLKREYEAAGPAPAGVCHGWVRTSG